MSDSQEFVVVAFDSNEFDPSWPPKKLSDFRSWIEEKYLSIPCEFRDSAEIEIMAYDSEAASMCIYYKRPGMLKNG